MTATTTSESLSLVLPLPFARNGMPSPQAEKEERDDTQEHERMSWDMLGLQDFWLGSVVEGAIYMNDVFPTIHLTTAA